MGTHEVLDAAVTEEGGKFIRREGPQAAQSADQFPDDGLTWPLHGGGELLAECFRQGSRGW